MPAFLLSLRGQLILLLLAVLLAAQAVSLVFFVDERSLAVRTALGFEAVGRAASVARLLEEAPDELHDAILRAANSPLVRFSLAAAPTVDRHDHPVDGGAVEERIRTLLGDPYSREVRVDLHEIEGNLLPLPELGEEMTDLHTAMMRGETSAVEMRISVALVGGEWLNVGTRFERPPLQWAWDRALSFVLTAGGLLAAGFWFLMSRITGPLQRLAVASERLGRGEELATIPPTGPSEVRELTGTFNQMQARLTRLVEDRTRMLAAIGHDLRSPLTALRVRSEMLDDEEARARLVGSVEEMQSMLDATLAYARGVTSAEPSEQVEIGQFLADLNRDSAAPFTLLPGPEIRATVRPIALRRALRNLVENAQRYGAGTAATVAYGAEDGVLSITVSDGGPGIPQDQLEQVFSPFFRLETSRSRETGGHGLGLSIARSIMRAHGGDIALSNAAGGGLVARATLPLDDPDAEPHDAGAARPGNTDTGAAPVQSRHRHARVNAGG